jgi:hypothetical protein
MVVDMTDNVDISDNTVKGPGEVLPRRRPLSEMPGVYYRPMCDGSIGPPWEFRYVDAAGRRRWQVVRGSLAEVEARRVTRTATVGLTTHKNALLRQIVWMWTVGEFWCSFSGSFLLGARRRRALGQVDEPRGASNLD